MSEAIEVTASFNQQWERVRIHRHKLVLRTRIEKEWTVAGREHFHLRTPRTADGSHESHEAAGPKISRKLMIDVFKSCR